MQSIVCFTFCVSLSESVMRNIHERWGAGVETQKNVRGEIGGWGRVPFNETYSQSCEGTLDSMVP